MDWREEFRLAREATERAIRHRNAQLAEGLDEIEARGRKIAGDAIRAGRDVVARTPGEIRRLGMAAAAVPRAVEQTARAAAAPVKRVVAEVQTPAGRARLLENAEQQGRAALSGAVDEASLGLADPILSGGEAIAQGGLNGVRARFDANLARREAEDTYDSDHYGLARGVGQAAGIAATVVGTGAVGAGAKAIASRVAPKVFAKVARAANSVTRVADMTPGGLTSLALTGGAAAGAGGQIANDVLSGRVGTPGDYAGAIAGGAVSGLMLRGGRIGNGRIADAVQKVSRVPTVAGGAEGGLTAALQAQFNGQQADPVAIARAARDGAVGARIGDVLGKYGANALTTKAKERFGEGLTVLKGFAAGEGTPWSKPVENFETLLPVLPFKGSAPSPGAQRRIALPSGGHTRADFVTNKAVALEAKMGANARLQPRQIQAIEELPPERYRIYHWLPSDIGRIAALPGSILARGPDDEGRR